MNATKRLLTGAAIAAGALGIGAGTFFACRQELSPGAQSEAAGAERRAGDAKYDDGVYVFYFKNGASARGDCDGYNSEPGGKTTIYEYWKSDINEWEKRLKSAGVNPEVYRTSKAGKYCWVRFDTSLLAGIGFDGDYEYEGTINGNLESDDELDLVTKNGTKLNFKTVARAYYAQAHSNFALSKHDNMLHENTIEWLKGDRNYPVLLIVFNESGINHRENARNVLRDAGISIPRGGKTADSYLIADASKISWFAYNQ